MIIPAAAAADRLMKSIPPMLTESGVQNTKLLRTSSVKAEPVIKMKNPARLEVTQPDFLKSRLFCKCAYVTLRILKI